MTTDDYKPLVQETYDLLEKFLPNSIKDKVTKNNRDPSRVVGAGRGIDQYRVRILPVRKSMVPSNFWSSAWCFYEIAAGTLGDPLRDNLAFGQVQFMHAPNTKPCGLGRYTSAVESILKRLHALRPRDLHLFESSKGCTRIHLIRRYRPPKPPHYQPQLAAKDLAWLIEQTLEKFQGIQP